jgi:hypothetical protein
MLKGQPDKRLAAVCGLFCPACSAFIGTKEEPERLQAAAKHFQRTAEELQCHGCRSEKRSFFCHQYCKMASCAAEKGIDFCGACADYPCAELKAFQAQAPHRIELWQYQQRIREAGYEKWYAEMEEHYACPQCRTINSAYDIACRKCGATPGSAYAGLHKEEITRHLSKIKA